MFRQEEAFVPTEDYWCRIAALDEELHAQDPDKYRFGVSAHAEGVWLPTGEPEDINPLESMTPHSSWESRHTSVWKISGSLTVGRVVGFEGDIDDNLLLDADRLPLREGGSEGNVLVRERPLTNEPSLFETTYIYTLWPYSIGRSVLEVSYGARIHAEISGKLAPFVRECSFRSVVAFERFTGFRTPRDEQFMELLGELRHGAAGAMRLTDEKWWPLSQTDAEEHEPDEDYEDSTEEAD